MMDLHALMDLFLGFRCARRVKSLRIKVYHWNEDESDIFTSYVCPWMMGRHEDQAHLQNVL